MVLFSISLTTLTHNIILKTRGGHHPIQSNWTEPIQSNPITKSWISNYNWIGLDAKSWILIGLDRLLDVNLKIQLKTDPIQLHLYILKIIYIIKNIKKYNKYLLYFIRFFFVCWICNTWLFSVFIFMMFCSILLLRNVIVLLI